MQRQHSDNNSKQSRYIQLHSQPLANNTTTMMGVIDSKTCQLRNGSCMHKILANDS